jgi:DNA repair exonuclease SbcCD ATPase subunit
MFVTHAANSKERSPMLETDQPTATSRAKADPAETVFLSPRVIDREAFNDYSASLRRLIEEAAHQAEALKAAAAEAMQAQTALRETAARHQGKADNVTRALAAIDQRLAEADRLAQAAEATRKGIEAASVNAQSALAARSDELAARLDSAAVAATETVRRAEHGSTEAVMNLVGSAERKLAQVEAKLIEFKPRTAAAVAAPVAAPQPVAPAADTSRVQQLLTLLAAEREKTEARSAQLKTLCEQAERSRAALTEALSAATAKAEAATGSAKAVTAQTEVVVMRLARVIEAMPS